MSGEYNPASLPEITSVEISVLGRRSVKNIQAQFITHGREGFPILKSLTVSGKEADEIADLWRKLPEGNDQDRCHIPPFGLRFYKDNDLVLSASICWECSNIWLREGDLRSGYILDAEHEISQALLQLLKKLSSS